MAQRGRKPKIKTVITEVDYSKLLKEDQLKYETKMKSLYKKLSTIKYEINSSLYELNNISECKTLAEAAYIAGKSHVPLYTANDKLEDVLDEMYDEEDFDHWDDISNDF